MATVPKDHVGNVTSEQETLANEETSHQRTVLRGEELREALSQLSLDELRLIENILLAIEKRRLFARPEIAGQLARMQKVVDAMNDHVGGQGYAS